MGKSLVIKGADFSANAIDTSVEWFYNGFSSHYGQTPVAGIGDPISAGWSHVDINAALVGKTFNKIRCLPKSAGTYNFYIVSQEPSSIQTPLSNPVATITVSAEDVDNVTIYTLSTPITLNQGEYLVHGESNLPGGATIAWLGPEYETGVDKELYFRVGTESANYNGKFFYMFDFGY